MHSSVAVDPECAAAAKAGDALEGRAGRRVAVSRRPCSIDGHRIRPTPPHEVDGERETERVETRRVAMNIQAVDYSTKIPNNVNLTEDRAGAARAGELASRLHRLVEDHGAGGLPGGAGLSAHRGLGRSQGLGEIRLREDARLPLGHPAGAAGGGPQDSVRPATSASRPGRRCRANTAPCCGG